MSGIRLQSAQPLRQSAEDRTKTGHSGRGILLLADPRIRDLLDIKVYVEADADERILRRISRDVEERGRDLNGIIDQYLTTVKPMHYLYVEPTRAKADIVINSGKNNVAFDLFVSKIGQLLKELKK